MRSRISFSKLAAVVVTLLAVALGGSTYLPAQMVLAALAGLLSLLAPPRALPRVPSLLAVALLLIALAAFLPATSSPPWRHYLATEAQIPLPSLRTPQPWLTAQGCCLLFLGLAWGLYLLARPCERGERILAVEALAFGIALLAAVAAAAFLFHFHVPGWVQDQNRGWFPNRNQTADVLALMGITTYALIFDRLRKGKIVGYALLAALVPIVAELVISYSRAGILLFFGGVLLWHLWPRPGGGRASSAKLKWVALSAALGLVLVAIFLAFGGATLARFQQSSGTGADDFSDFRGAIQLDALRFSSQSPLLGVGVSDFEPLFSFSRAASINGNRAIHPESDWLWIACEMGWPAIVVIAAGCVWWLRRVLPLEAKTGESMRRALIVAVLIFLVHGFVDVSAHRPGSLFVALLLAGLALPPTAVTPSRMAAPVFRLLGLLLLALAGWWGASLGGQPVPPTTATLARLQAAIAASTATSDTIARDATAALDVAPLDWNLYVERAAAELDRHGQVDSAVRDEAVARALDPYFIPLALDEGRTLSAAGQPDLALDAWRDGLRRAGPESPELYREIAGWTPPRTIERQGLLDLARDRPDYLLIILPGATREEAAPLLDHLLETDPQLHAFSAVQRAQLFAAWWAQGDPVRLMQVLGDHPEWADSTWMYQARYAARENDFRHACEIAQRHIPPPIVPQSNSSEPPGDLATDFGSHPESISSGLLLLLAQMRAGQNDAALETLHLLAKLPDRPRYLDYIEASLEMQRGDWAAAWKAWDAYLQP